MFYRQLIDAIDINRPVLTNQRQKRNQRSRFARTRCTSNQSNHVPDCKAKCFSTIHDSAPINPPAVIAIASKKPVIAMICKTSPLSPVTAVLAAERADPKADDAPTYVTVPKPIDANTRDTKGHAIDDNQEPISSSIIYPWQNRGT